MKPPPPRVVPPITEIAVGTVTDAEPEAESAKLVLAVKFMVATTAPARNDAWPLPESVSLVKSIPRVAEGMLARPPSSDIEPVLVSPCGVIVPLNVASITWPEYESPSRGIEKFTLGPKAIEPEAVTVVVVVSRLSWRFWRSQPGTIVTSGTVTVPTRAIPVGLIPM